MLILQKNAVLKTSVCSCENRAPQTGPSPSPSHRRLAGNVLKTVEFISGILSRPQNP